MSIDGILFAAAHIPPKAFNFDSLILALLKLHQFLRAPRLFIQWVWPGEQNPWFFGWLLTLLNSLIWGLACASIKQLFRGRRR